MFVGQAFQNNGQKSSCKFQVNEIGLIIQLPGSNLSKTISWNKVNLRLGGAHDKLVFFELDDPDLSSVFMHKTKANLLQLKMVSHHKITDFFVENQGRNIRFYLILFSSSLALVLLISALYSLRHHILQIAVDQVPYSWEAKLGEQVIDLVVPRDQRISSPKILEQLTREMRPLYKNLPAPFNQAKIYISSSPELNAFALPGGYIVLNKGLLEKADTIEEVLGVMAHELAHVKKRHVLHSMVRSIGVFVIVDFLIGDLSGILAVLADNSQMLVNASFSRSQESQADQLAYQALKEEKISPVGLITFLERVQSMKKNKSHQSLQKVLYFLQTHPDTDQRIKSLRNFMAQDNIEYNDVEFNYSKFKQTLTISGAQ